MARLMQPFIAPLRRDYAPEGRMPAALAENPPARIDDEICAMVLFNIQLDGAGIDIRR